MVKWISLHAAARKGLPMLGRSLAKQKSNCLLFLGPFFGLTSGWWEPGCRKHTLGSVRGECWCMWTVGTSGVSLSSYRHQSSEAEREWGAWIQQCITTCSLHCCTLLLLLFLLISLFLFFSLNRYHNMGNLLKVLTCTDLEQEPNFFLDFESEFSF